MLDTDGKPLLVDLFCKAGGSSRGYADAGFFVVGVDIEDQPNYPYPFYRGDAFDLLPKLLRLLPVAAVGASPPCQAYSSLTPAETKPLRPDLVEPTRELLRNAGLPYIMENVNLAPLELPTMLCGTTFGLGVAVVEDDGTTAWHELQRHRYFESDVPLFSPGPCKHQGPVVGVYGKPGGFDRRRQKKLHNTAQWAAAMGIDWMGASELAQSVPPAFTRFLGKQLMAQL